MISGTNANGPSKPTRVRDLVDQATFAAMVVKAKADASDLQAA